MLRPKSSLENPKTIVIAGYFGFGNAGDELILSAMINGLRARSPNLGIIILSGSPQSTQKKYLVDSIAWDDYAGTVQAISNCDLVILGGGGLFHDYWGVEEKTIFTSKHSGFSFYSSIALLASIHKKKLMLFAVGVGPLLSDQGKKWMKLIADQADLITVRDDDSKHQLLALNVSDEKISVTADAVFTLIDLPQFLTKKSTQKGHPVLGVALRHWDVGVNSVHWQHETALALDAFLNAHPDGKVQFIPFQNSKDSFLDDYSVAKSVQGMLKNKTKTLILPRNSKISDLMESISQCDLILGMRLHSVILALINHIPVIGINYDPKVQVLLSQCELEKNLIEITNFDSTILFRLLEENGQNQTEISKRIQAKFPKLLELANRNFDQAIQLLKSNPQPLPEPSGLTQVLSNSALSLSLALDQQQKQTLTLEKKLQELMQNMALVVSQKTEVDRKLETSQKELLALSKKMAYEENEWQTKYSTLKNSLKENQNQLNQNKIELAHNLHELESIKSSRGWKLLFKLWELRLVFFPKDSRREAFFKMITFRNSSNNQQILQKASRWMKRKFSPKLTWPSLAFRTYQLKRQRLWPEKLDGLNKPYEPGLVSIILPVHNGERYVGEAVQSILEQTYTNFELIIVDDGSTDATASILRKFAHKDQRIRVIHQVNLKLPGALNTGFASANGEFFTWTSDDNLMTSKYLEKMVACLRRHPSWHMTYANMDLMDETGAPLRNSTWYEGYQFPHHSEHIFLPTDPSELNVIPNNYIGGAFLYRRLVADLLAGYSPFQYTREDYDYWMQVNSLFTLKHADFNEPVYKYRIHSTSLTSQDSVLKITEDRKFLMTFEDFRRDYYLMPLVWIFEDDQFENPAVIQIKESLKNHGQIVLSLTDFFHQIVPIRWIPSIHIKICSSKKEIKDFISTPQECIYSIALTVSNLQTVRPIYEATLASNQMTHPFSITSEDPEALLKAIDIKCRSLALHGIEKQTWLPQVYPLKLSVVICTYDRNTQLELCLRAIARQSISQSKYEVIVVDNNPDSSELLHLIEQNREWEFFRNPEYLRLIQCPIRGLSYSRNAGIAESRGEWVLFLDDDALAESDLVEKYFNAIEKHPEAGLIGGHILLHRPEHLEMPWQPGWERYWSHFETNYKDYTAVSDWAEFPWGANWCARRQALFQIGGFRGAYGRRGKDFSGGEEIIAARLIQKLGYSIGILPQARVIHEVDPSRFTLDHLEHTILAGQLVRYQSELDQYLPRELSLPLNPIQWIKQIQKKIRKSPNKMDSDAQCQRLESAYLISAKRKLLRKHLLTECARYKFLYPFLKGLL